MLSTGDQVHHYIVEARVGGGGTASVYRVRHAILQSVLALKVLDADLVDRPDLRRRFLAEGRIQARVRHPGIVMVTDAVVDAPRRLAGLVMEFVEGPNLAELIARMKQPPDAALFRSIAVPVLDALHHAHREGVVHRDVKPSNILLSRDAGGIWHPRLADFGIAHVLADAPHVGSSRITEPEGRLGTPAFMAPEQVDGGEPTPAWDVFAMGCVLYELATGGVHPFERESPSATLAAIRRGTALAPSAIFDRIDKGIEAAILAALQREPDKRPASCAELIAMLDSSRAVLAQRPTPIEPVAPPTAGPLPPTHLETTGAAHQRRAWKLTEPEVTVGRAGVAVPLGPVANVEPEHCVLRWTGQAWVLEDRSQEGTRVNGARVSSIALEDGDLIRVGHQVLKFHTEAPPPPLPAPSRTPSVAAPVPAAQPLAEVPTGPRLEIPRRALGGQGPDPLVVAVGTTPLVIGRDPACDLVLTDPLCSPRHCQVTLQGLDVFVQDLSSRNGTHVDDQPVRMRSLRDGATIGVGGTRIRFRAR